MTSFATQIELLFSSFQAVISPEILLIIAGATTLGIIVGAIPGLTGTMALALLINVTYHMKLDHAVAFLLSVYVGAIMGGCYSAIMINIPGTPAAAATALDGFPLAKQGKGGKAITVGKFLWNSVFLPDTDFRHSVYLQGGIEIQPMGIFSSGNIRHNHMRQPIRRQVAG
jgi:TctA family transporter